MTNNIMKKFLRMLGMVWCVALTIMVFTVLLLRLDLVKDLLTSTPVVAVGCIVVGAAFGFVAGAIACFLNTSKAVDAKDSKIKKLQNELNSIKKDYDSACKTLANIYNQRAQQQKEIDSTRGKALLSEIADLSDDCEESTEETAEECSHLQEEEFEDVESSTESET